MKPHTGIRKTAILLAAVIPGMIFLFIPTLLKGRTDWSEYYDENIYPYLSKPIVYLSSLVPVSLTEIFIVFAAVSGLLWLIWIFVRFLRSDSKRRFLYRGALILGIAFSLFSVSFVLMHGINYTRVPLDASLPLDASQRSKEDLAEVTLWLAQNTARTRAELPEDGNGCMVLSTSITQALADGSRALDAAAVSFPVLGGAEVTAKPVALSHYWSYTGITGMYFPFFGEANVNIDIPQSQLPMTICHEVSHVRGIAREQDANLAAFLACISSSRTDFQYCAYQYGYLYCAWDLSKADPESYAEISALIPDSVSRDWAQNTEYWKQFEGPVQETSTQINNTYLQMNLQEEGVLSYDRVTDLIVDYYFTYVKGQ